MDKYVIKEKKSKTVEAVEKCVETEDDSADVSTKRKFRIEWLQKFSWLKNNNGKAYCVMCEKTITNNLCHLARHEQNKAHCCNMEAKKAQLKLDVFVNEERSNLAKQVQAAELTIVMFCIIHNLPFRLLDFLTNLLCICCPDSQIAKAMRCRRTKGTYLAGVLGNRSKEKIVSVLQNQRFSLIVDETTDLSCRKALVLVVRFFDSLSRSIKDRFLQLIELEKTDSETIYQAIKTFFDTNNIPLSNLIGLATDGASTMAGNLNGLKAKLSHGANLFYLKCTCHSLHLCSSYACKKLPNQIEELCRNVYKFFAYSPKRVKDFQEFQDFCEVKPHKILGISLTRWLALEAVITRIVEQWEPLQLYFLSYCLEVNGIKSQYLANLMGDTELKAYMLFLTYILKIINNLNKEFQAESVRLPYLYENMESNFKLILSNYICDNYIKTIGDIKLINIQNTKEFLPIYKVYIGAKAEKYIQSNIFSTEQRNSIKENARKFYIELLEQISSRFDFGRQDIKNLIILSPSKIFVESEVSILPLINEFFYLIDGDPEDIVTQWRLLRIRRAEFKDYSNIENFWEKVSLVKNGANENAFEDLSKFVFCLLSLPYSSAAAERKFFNLSLVKTKLRNKLEFKTLNSIMLSKELAVDDVGLDNVWSAHDFFIDS